MLKHTLTLQKQYSIKFSREKLTGFLKKNADKHASP